MAPDDAHADAGGGAGLFGLNLGIGAPIAMLVLHIVFGAVLGPAGCGPDVRPPPSGREPDLASEP